MAGISQSEGRASAEGAPAPAPPATTESPSEERRLLLILTVILFLLAAVYPFLRISTYQGSAEAHATIEVLGGLLGLLAGAGFVTRFWSLGQRFHLFVGLAFFANGAEDAVHGLFEMARYRGWVDLADQVFGRSIPATYVTGRLLMGILLILAPFLPAWLGRPRSPKLETAVASLVALILTAAGTIAPARVFVLGASREVLEILEVLSPEDAALKERLKHAGETHISSQRQEPAPPNA